MSKGDDFYTKTYTLQRLEAAVLQIEAKLDEDEKKEKITKERAEQRSKNMAAIGKYAGKYILKIESAAKKIVIAGAAGALIYSGITLGLSYSNNEISDLENKINQKIVKEIAPLDQRKGLLQEALKQKIADYNSNTDISDKTAELDVWTKQNKETQDNYQIAIKDIEQLDKEYSALDTQINDVSAKVEELYATSDSLSSENKTKNESLNLLLKEQIEIENKVNLLKQEYDSALKSKESKNLEEITKLATSYAQTVESLKNMNAKLGKITEKLENGACEK